MTFRCLALLAAAALLAGCGSAPPSLAAPTGLMPDLRGTWAGAWGGAAVTLVIIDQTDAAPTEGISVGSWQLLGQALPGVSGVLSVMIRGEMVSVNVQGRLGTSHGRLALVLAPATVNGGWIGLTRLDETRMIGTGTSQMSWEPQGPVELIRKTRPPPA